MQETVSHPTTVMNVVSPALGQRAHHGRRKDYSMAQHQGAKGQSAAIGVSPQRRAITSPRRGVIGRQLAGPGELVLLAQPLSDI